MSYLRHGLCYLKKECEPLASSSQESQSLFKHWINEGFPLIVTRQPSNVTEQQCQLAIPFLDPLTRAKHRFSFIVNKADVKKTSDLPNLSQIYEQWLENDYFPIKVFGSHCWQYLTKKEYVQKTSDLDLLITYQNQSINQLGALYHSLQLRLNIPDIDCELRFKHLGDCSLNELLNPNQTAEILFKSESDVALLKREFVYENYPALLS